MAGDHEGCQAMIVRQIGSERHSIQLRLLPGDRECHRRVEEDIEVVSVGRALVEVISIQHDVLAHPLLEADIELVAFARLQRQVARVAENAITQAARARLLRVAVANVRAFLSGQSVNVVN